MILRIDNIIVEGTPAECVDFLEQYRGKFLSFDQPKDGLNIPKDDFCEAHSNHELDNFIRNY